MYVYAASSWKNLYHVGLCAAMRSAKIEHYDFKADGFSWAQVDTDPHKDFMSFIEVLEDPIAVRGFNRDFDAMQRATHFVLTLPSGRSAHLEAGWAIGQGKPTAIWVPEFDGPDLMYKMADLVTDNLMDLLDWLGVKD